MNQKWRGLSTDIYIYIYTYTGSVVENESGKSTPLSDDVVPTPRHMEFTTNAELNLSCCILMLDILLKQVSIQLEHILKTSLTNEE